MPRFAFGSAIAASAFLVVIVPALPALAASDWGFTCSDLATLESKKECCVQKQTDCNAECYGNYHDESLATCQRLCNEKGDKCRAEIKGETSGMIRPDDWRLIATGS